jgi:hypothetical protein
MQNARLVKPPRGGSGIRVGSALPPLCLADPQDSSGRWSSMRHADQNVLARLTAAVLASLPC